MKLSFLNCFRPPVVAEEVGEASKKQDTKVKKTFWAKFAFLRKKKGRKCGTPESEVSGRDDNYSVVEEEENDSMRAVEKAIGVNMASVEVTEDTNEYKKELQQVEAEMEAVLEEIDETENKIKEMVAMTEAFVEKEIGVNMALVEVTEDVNEYKKELQQVEMEAVLQEIDETGNKIKEMVAMTEAFVEKEIGVNMALVEVTEDINEYKKELQQVEAEMEAVLEEIDETGNKIKEMVAVIEAFWKSFEVDLQVQ